MSASSNFLQRGLKAADWFVNTQVLMQKPHWDANHGRAVYTYHIPTQTVTLGLSWTQGRAIITLLQAFEATGDGKYLRSAIQAAEYIKHLQILDQRDTRRFGAIREECPSSWYVYPRDALEAGIGLLLLYRLTADQEYLYRARIFGDWFLKAAMADENGTWTKAAFYLYEDDEASHLQERSFCLGGGSYFFAWLAHATGSARYLDQGFKPLVKTQMDDFVRDDGVISSRILGAESDKSGTEELSHHGGGEGRYAGVAVNDDCLGINMLVAYKELGDQLCLDKSVAYGEWMISDPGPIPNFSARALRAMTLLELSAVCGDEKYANFAREQLAPLFMADQKLDTGDPAIEGAFSGEDEPAHYYAPEGARAEDFVNTRTTAYAANALFKMDGTVFGPYYSALNWDRQPLRSPEGNMLEPYRI
jgi:rhamnogalacturonyl hydrolase YesR